MKIVDTDNFGSDYPDEKFVAQELNEYWAKKIEKLLNDDAGEYSNRHYKVVNDDYKLQPGFEP